MKKNIVILGSTGSIGKNLIEILKKDKKNFNIILLTANKNIALLIKQAIQFNVKNIIVTDSKSFILAKNKLKNIKINIYNSFSSLDKILYKKKIFYSMSAIVGIDGLYPCLNLIKYTKHIAIANKEAIICGWSLIRKYLDKYKTNFIPVDSEHFSIYTLLKDKNYQDIEKIYITASGGPLFNKKKTSLKRIKLIDTLKHPNWKMGKKITIDTSTMMNKVFEVIEAKNIFDIDYKNINILVHPKSYIHSLIIFKKGTIKILAHEPDMKIPIFSSVYQESIKQFTVKDVNLDILNNLQLSRIDKKQFPLVKIIDSLPKFNSLYETVLVSINDYFVNLYLDNKIDYLKLIKSIKTYINRNEFKCFKNKKITNLNQIFKTRKYVTSILDKISI